MTGTLTPDDYAAHARLRIEPDVLDAAQVHRVTHRQAVEDCGLTYHAADLAGIDYPYIDPWSGRVVGHRVRRDHPDIEDGRPHAKYISSSDRAHPYFVAGTTAAALGDVQTPIVLVEAEKSALAITCAAGRAGRSIVAIGLGGCWNFFGRIGKLNAADGTRVDERGPLPDWGKVEWKGRSAYIALDSNARTNLSVQAARRKIAADLKERGANVRIVEIPALDGINGPDDLIGTRGDAAWWVLVDIATDDAGDHDGARGPTPTTLLVDLALTAGIELWHTAADDAYATVTVGDHREHHPLRRVVRDYLARTYYTQHGRTASSAALTDALATLGGMARYDGPTHPVAVRLAHHEGTVYLDLGDADWRAVAIDAAGWRVVSEPPVRFWRPASMRTLPAPVPGGTIDALRGLWPVDDDTWTLIVAWVIAALSRGPYPILVETGEPGSGKSTLGRMVRGLIDPASPELRGVTRVERDVMISALTSHVVALDNLSDLPAWLSDVLCRVASGGGHAARTLYTDLDETTIDVMRPILLNGIASPATRPDLLDRSLVVTLPAMSDEARGDEADLWRRYREMRPAVLGALCDAVSSALRREEAVQLTRRPRMADACRWATAAAPALGWSDERIVCAWLGARAEASAELLATDPIALALLALPDESFPWQGFAGELLALLTGRVPESGRAGRTWPRSARQLSSALKQLVPDLRRAGVSIVLPVKARTARERIITIRKAAATPDKQDRQDSSTDSRQDPAPACPDDGPLVAGGAETGREQDSVSLDESGLVSDVSDVSCSTRVTEPGAKGVSDGRF